MFKLTPDQQTTLTGLAGGIAAILAIIIGKTVDPTKVYDFMLLAIFILSITVGILGKLSPGLQKKINEVEDDASKVLANLAPEFQQFEKVIPGSGQMLQELSNKLTTVNQIIETQSNIVKALTDTLTKKDEVEKTLHELITKVTSPETPSKQE